MGTHSTFGPAAVGDRPSGTPPAGPAVPAAGKSPCTCKIRRYLHFSTALFIILFIIFHWFLWVCHYVFMCLAPSFLPSWGGAVTRIPKSKRRRLPPSLLAGRSPRLDRLLGAGAPLQFSCIGRVSALQRPGASLAEHVHVSPPSAVCGLGAASSMWQEQPVDAETQSGGYTKRAVTR